MLYCEYCDIKYINKSEITTQHFRTNCERCEKDYCYQQSHICADKIYCNICKFQFYTLKEYKKHNEKNKYEHLLYKINELEEDIHDIVESVKEKKELEYEKCYRCEKYKKSVCERKYNVKNGEYENIEKLCSKCYEEILL
jgi:hypothetical protein